MAITPEIAEPAAGRRHAVFHPLRVAAVERLTEELRKANGGLAR